MGHLVGKDLYKKLGKKIDGSTVRAPWNTALYNLLKELYSEDEAGLVVKMPYRPSDLNRIARSAAIDETTTQKLLDGLCEKGLVIDLWNGERYEYMMSPMVIGIFEFTMMRTGGLDLKKTAKLFQEYMFGDDSFFRENFRNGEIVSPMRAFPYEESILPEDYVEIMDFERAEELIMKADKFAVGLCSCRHEKLHLDEYRCGTPLETCSSINSSADYMIRHNLAKEVSREEMLYNLKRSKELGLVITGDVTTRDVGFMCHCCSCCCNLLLGYTKFGYTGTIVSSRYIAVVGDACTGCGRCVRACPVKAISFKEKKPGAPGPIRKAAVDESICIGCGVCSKDCGPGAVILRRRKQRVYYPEDTIERVVIASLERGTLQNLVFDDPSKFTHAFMRAFLGAFLKMPAVKKSIISDTFRSRFLRAVR